ncbi:MAG: YggS family pyridoxal phosphate-dependent enzyme [Gammaproteobacteria bacterium]|nr:YggS family pyridoxal phosphate-dependent enzyme [Gammaproteobacteria bacterium]
MHKIAIHLMQVRNRIDSAAARCGRSVDSVQLLAVSKTRPPADIRAAYAAGQHRFGENYLQEALDKQQQLADLDIEWHFIGPLQANKTRPVAEHFAWVHSVDREKIARRLSAQRPASLPPLNICLQVNLDSEASKAGVSLAELPELLDSVAELPNIRTRGLMAIPAPRTDFEHQREALEPLATALLRLRASHPALDTLSMGMSADLEAAVAAGSTMVRIGTDIFGRRD